MVRRAAVKGEENGFKRENGFRKDVIFSTALLPTPHAAENRGGEIDSKL